jgi:hypothetical protein
MGNFVLILMTMGIFAQWRAGLPVAGNTEGNFDLVLEPAGEEPHKAVKRWAG